MKCPLAESSTSGVKRGRGRGRRGRLSHGSHDNVFHGNGPIPSSSTDSSQVSGSSGMGLIFGGDGEEKGKKIKVHVIWVLIRGTSP